MTVEDTQDEVGAEARDQGPAETELASQDKTEHIPRARYLVIAKQYQEEREYRNWADALVAPAHPIDHTIDTYTQLQPLSWDGSVPRI